MKQSGISPRDFTYFAFIVLALAFVGLALDEEQATADALYEAQEAIRDECGGPEASFDQVAVGQFQCYTKNGKRSVMITY